MVEWWAKQACGGFVLEATTEAAAMNPIYDIVSVMMYGWFHLTYIKHESFKINAMHRWHAQQQAAAAAAPTLRTRAASALAKAAPLERSFTLAAAASLPRAPVVSAAAATLR